MNTLINFVAFCLPLLLFTYWGIVGYATLIVLRSQRNILQNLLLAPTFGFAVTLLPIFWLNRWGLPVSQFASFLGAFLLGISVILFWQRKPYFPIKNYLPFFALSVLALFVTGRPFLLFGFDWISYGNHDMANYASRAFRFLNHGYFDIPDINMVAQGKDFSQLYWFMDVPGLTRSGSDLMLSWIAGVTHLTTIQIFMPTILAFHLMLISATGAMVCQSKNKRLIAFTAVLLLSCSALTTLGTLYQLIAQVSGLSLLAVLITLLLQPFTHKKRWNFLYQGITIATLLSALLITYPEVVPFLFVTLLLYFVILYCKGWRSNRSFYATAIVASISLILFLNFYLVAAFNFMVIQSTLATIAKAKDLTFPYYLLPSGFANFWGLQSIGTYALEPWMSSSILVGIIFSLVALLAMLILIWRIVSPPALVVLVMLLVGVYLFISSADFALFKLAMFMQPFLISTIAITLFTLLKSKSVRILVIIIFIASNFSAINFYVMRSNALTPGPLSEISYASNSKITQEYANLVANLAQDTTIVLNDFNNVILGLQSLESQNMRVVEPVTPPSIGVISFEAGLQKSPITKFLRNIDLFQNKVFYTKTAYTLFQNYIARNFHTQQFSLLDKENASINFFATDLCGDSTDCTAKAVLVSSTGKRGVINNRRTNFIKDKNFLLQRFQDAHNYLNFIDSSAGSIYYTMAFKDGEVSLFNFENDIVYPNQIMQAIGQYLLFRVYNPDPQFRVALTITNTFNGDGINQLPSAIAIGKERTNFPFIGRGSGRVFSEPLSAQLINGVPYIVIDLNRKGKRFSDIRTGIMRFYGKKIPIDARRLVSFARDISVISEEEYQKLNAPSIIKNFPIDLANGDLEYSGIYEDGWISENAFLQLKQPLNSKQLLISGMIPKIDTNFTNIILTILINGNILEQRLLGIGEYELKIPVDPSQQRRKVELHYSQTQKLPNGDGRPVASRINMIGFI